MYVCIYIYIYTYIYIYIYIYIPYFATGTTNTPTVLLLLLLQMEPNLLPWGHDKPKRCPVYVLRGEGTTRQCKACPVPIKLFTSRTLCRSAAFSLSLPGLWWRFWPLSPSLSAQIRLHTCGCRSSTTAIHTYINIYTHNIHIYIYVCKHARTHTHTSIEREREREREREPKEVLPSPRLPVKLQA